MEEKTIRIAVISDLHYRTHQSGLACRPSVSDQGQHDDPMVMLIDHLRSESRALVNSDGRIADYLLCPGDIADKASEPAFDEGWSKLKALQQTLSAKHLITSTGNHEIDSRASRESDTPGNVEIELDPLKALQKHSDYPSTAFVQSDRRWIYWGRGYEFIDEEDILFLLINSSHYHWTTRENEFQRGRIGEVALEELRKELRERVKSNASRAFVALLHHHPIPHQDLDVDLGRIEMSNGARLIEALDASGVPWLIIHGHKHHARLLPAQGGPSRPVVFAAGTFGAVLSGKLATQTKQQFYLLDVSVLSQQIRPEAAVRVRALTWSGSNWIWTTKKQHGLPDRCGFRTPQLDIVREVEAIKNFLDQRPETTFFAWQEVVEGHSNLKYLLPSEITVLQRAMDAVGIKYTWKDDDWFPSEISR